MSIIAIVISAVIFALSDADQAKDDKEQTVFDYRDNPEVLDDYFIR